MPRVDPDDDSVRRFLVRRYAYDPDRHERRHIVVGAYDNEDEFQEHFERQDRELRDAEREESQSTRASMSVASASNRARRAGRPRRVL